MIIEYMIIPNTFIIYPTVYGVFKSNAFATGNSIAGERAKQ